MGDYSAFGFNFSIFLCGWFTIESFLDNIKDTTHTNGTEKVFKRYKWISDAKEEGRKLEVYKEYDNSKVYKSMRAEIKSVFLSITKIRAARMLALVEKFGTKNSTAVGVQTPRQSLSPIFTNPAPFPLIAPIAIITIYALGKSLAAWVTPS